MHLSKKKVPIVPDRCEHDSICTVPTMKSSPSAELDFSFDLLSQSQDMLAPEETRFAGATFTVSCMWSEMNVRAVSAQISREHPRLEGAMIGWFPRYEFKSRVESLDPTSGKVSEVLRMMAAVRNMMGIFFLRDGG